MKSSEEPQASTSTAGVPLSGALLAVLACAAVTLLALPLRAWLNPANLLVLYLLPVLWVAARSGWLPGVLAALLGVLAFDVFMVPPYYSVRVEDTQYLVSFAMLFAVALVVGRLTAQLKQEAQQAARREARTQALFELARELLGANDMQAALRIADRHSQRIWQCPTLILVADAKGRLLSVGGDPALAPAAHASAQALFDAAAQGKDMPALSSAAGACLIPLQSAHAWRGVLVLPGIERAHARLHSSEFTTAWAALINLALDRIHYAELAQQAGMAAQSERLRNAILAAVSHDLRTPIAALLGLTGALMSQPGGTVQCKALCRAIEDEALRMDDMAGNLLQLARLQSGAPLDAQLQMLEEAIGPALKHVEHALAQHRLQTAIAEGLPLLRFDAVLIERVLSNLLTNAARQAPGDSTILLSAQMVDDGVRICVEDQGPGMSAQALERLRREDDTPAGAGLGLWISQRILRAHGSRLQANVLPSGGMRFCFDLARPAASELEGLAP